jgi:POT family proton-dependent oligopeptide transporter
VALGSGGIKPCVGDGGGSSFQPEQAPGQRGVQGVLGINFGSLFASLFVPLLLKHHGPAVAFRVPGVLMFVSTVIFWAGRITT